MVMIGLAEEQVIRELSDRAGSGVSVQSRRVQSTGARLLVAPILPSVRVLSARSAADRCAVATAVEDQSGDRYVVIREFTYDDGALRMVSGSEGHESAISDKRVPWLELAAYANGSFFACGRVQSGPVEVIQVKLVWDDGYVLEDAVENGIAMFFGARDSLDHASVEFFDRKGRMVGNHSAFGG